MEAAKYVRAVKGFSANGVVMAAGEYVSAQFDPQTIKVLVGMGRLEETYEAPVVMTEPEGKQDRSVGLPKSTADAPVGLPGLPGA